VTSPPGVINIARMEDRPRRYPSDTSDEQYFNQWEQAKVTEQILPVVREQLRLQEGRNPEPSAGLIDSQSVQGADTVGRESRGYDAGKKVNGRKRFIVTDTLGLLLTVVVLSASVQDRDSAKPALLQAYLCTGARFVFADRAFAGRLLDWAQTTLRTTLHIVRKPRRADSSRFVWSPHVHTLDFSSIVTGSGRDLRRPSAAVGPATALACAALVAPASEQAAGYVGPLGGWQRSAGYASN
jgi:hypothetical protein